MVGNFLCGLNLGGFNQSAEVVSAQLGWVGHKNIALANGATVFGLMLGSIFASSIVKIGLKNSAILANIIGIVGCIPQLFLGIWGFAVGKLILGLAGGLMIIASSIFISESLPAERVASCGTSVNLGIMGGILLIAIV